MSLAIRLGCAWAVGIVLVAATALFSLQNSMGWWASIGAVAAIPALFFLTIGIQCMLAARQNRLEGAPAAELGEWVGVWWRETLLSLRVFGLWQVALWRAPPDRIEGIPRGRTGVVFVHGFMCNRGVWRLWMQALHAEQRAFIAVSLEPVYGTVESYSPKIQSAIELMIERTGVPPVVVCHSMGGLVVRAWLRDVGPKGLTQVRHVITLGTPHQGTWLARFGNAPNARQMRRGSLWLAALQESQPSGVGAHLTCWYSNCDNIVFPALTGVHAGAEDRLASARGHLELVTDADVREQCLARVRALSSERMSPDGCGDFGKASPAASL